MLLPTTPRCLKEMFSATAFKLYVVLTLVLWALIKGNRGNGGYASFVNG